MNDKNIQDTGKIMGRVVRKPTFTYAKTKAQISCVYRAGDQRLCFRCIDSTIPLLHKSKITTFVVVHMTWTETSKTHFLMARLIK